MEKYDIPDEMKEKFEATNYKNYTIKAFMGTWCPDSKREIPRLYKLLDEIDFDLDNLTVYTMDYGKNTDDNYEKGLNIHHVPTIIVYDKNGKEIDRFVEKSRQSFLKDMLKIFQKKDYKDSYEK
jgi:thiol-disulfide isomerase/thioredoxin